MFRSRKPKTYSVADTEYGQVILDESHGRYWHLNDSAAIVVQCLQRGGSRTAAATALVDTYGIDDALALRDVDTTYDRMRQVGML